MFAGGGGGLGDSVWGENMIKNCGGPFAIRASGRRRLSHGDLGHRHGACLRRGVEATRVLPSGSKYPTIE